MLDVVDFHFRAGVLPDQDAIADLHLHRDALAVLVEAPRADGDDLALERLLLRRIRDDDSAFHFLLGFHPADQYAVIERLHLHRQPPCFWNAAVWVWVRSGSSTIASPAREAPQARRGVNIVLALISNECQS